MRQTFFITTIIATSLFLIAIPLAVKAADVFFIPQNSEHYNNDTFIKGVYVGTGDKHINTIKSEINFNPDIVEVVDIVKGESVIKLWIEEPTISNKKGTIKFSGGMPNGYKGNGLIFKIIFKAKNRGNCELNFSQTEAFLNDGKATKDKINIMANSCVIIEKIEDFIKITSQSHPDENKWYSNNHFNLYWDLVADAEYSYLLSLDPLSSPDTIADRPEGDLIWMGSMSYNGLEDGIYYFHLRQKLPDKEWSQKTTFRAMIDTTRPENFFAEVAEIEGQKFLVFKAEDKTSGVDHYLIKEKREKGINDIFQKVDEKDYKKVKSPYLLENQDLKNIIEIKAVDKAENEEKLEIFPVKKDLTLQQAVFALLFVAILIILLFIIKLFRRNKK